MILELGRGGDRHQQDLTIAGAGQAVIALAEGREYVVNDGKGGYNTDVVHGGLLSKREDE